MGKDYYDELGLTRSATDIDIKKAYRKLALKYHPDKNETAAASTKFAAVAEAYDVLSNAKNKGFYDLYGEEGLKQGVSDGKGGRRGGFYKFSTSPTLVFDQFFGTNNPYAALSEISESFEAMTATPKLKRGKQKTFDITVSLEDIFYGCIKKVPHTKKIMTASGTFETQDRILTLDIKPGCKDATRFVFDNEGNEAPHTEPGPVIYTLSTQKHPSFKRKGADLVYTAIVPLVKALSGTTLEIKTLDDRILSIPITEIVQQGSTKLIVGEGLPKGDGTKGDMLVVFDLLFPASLSDSQKMLLNAAFFLPPKPTAEQADAVKTFGVAFKDQLKGWSAGYKK